MVRLFLWETEGCLGQAGFNSWGSLAVLEEGAVDAQHLTVVEE